MDINEFHKMTHQGENDLRATACRLGKRLTGTLKPCPHCAKAKAKKKVINQVTEKLSLLPGKRIDIDVTGCKHTSIGGNKYANIKRDYHSGHLDITFMKKRRKL